MRGWYSDKSVLLQEPGNYLSVCIFESGKFTEMGEYDNMKDAIFRDFGLSANAFIERFNRVNKRF